MGENIRIVVLGTGQMATDIMKLLLQKPGLELAGVYARRTSRGGLDTLIIALTSVCATVTAITARRINDLSSYGPTVLRRQGIGLTPAVFIHGVQDSSVVGHFGFPESMSMIAKALGCRQTDCPRRN
jgi:hypothetical protein